MTNIDTPQDNGPFEMNLENHVAGAGEIQNPSRSSTRDVLIAARKLIEKPENWGKGMRFNRPVFESCCASEAIEEAISSNRFSLEKSEAFLLLMKAAGIEEGWGAIPNWNDAPERTHAEVLAAFDKAIAECSS